MKNLEVTKNRYILAVRKLRDTTLALSRDMARVALPSSLTTLRSTLISAMALMFERVFVERYAAFAR